MTRIVAVLPNYFGGGATVTDAIVKALGGDDFEFILVTEKVDKSRQIIAKNLYTKIIICDFPMARYSRDTTEQLASKIKDLNGDILWLIGDEYSDIPLLRNVIKPGAKVIFQLHSVPMYQVRMKDSFTGKPSDRVAYVKWLLLKHSREKLFHTYTRRYAKRTFATVHDVDKYVTLCEAYAAQLAELYPDFASKFVAIYNPAEPVVVDDCCVKRREIIFLGRLTFLDKRVDRLLDIFSKIADSQPDWKLRIVGDGPERKNLERQASMLGLEKRVEFCGFSSNPSEYLKTASIICMTSEFEGWPMALVEAMQYGVAPIAYGCSSGVRELLADGRGIVVEPGKSDIFATQLLQLMASEALRQRISAANTEFLKRLSIRFIANQWRNLFSS